MFALYISRNEPKSSRFWLGGVNMDYIKEKEITDWHPVVYKAWYSLSLDKVLLNGKDTGLCKPHDIATPNLDKCILIMDSGSTLCGVGNNQLTKFTKQIENGKKNLSYLDYPTITYVINGKHYDLERKDYLIVNDNINFLDESEIPENSKFDIGFIEFGATTKHGYKVWIGGDNFLSKFVTVFDRDNDRVGLGTPDFDNIKRIQNNEKKL